MRLNPDQLAKLRELVKRYAGLRVDDAKLSFSVARAWPTLEARGVLDGDALIQELGFLAGRLWMEFLPFVTINETYFMREPGQLDVFMEEAAPRLREAAIARGDGTLRVLSAACSTGEEPYSLAMMLADAGYRAEVLGVDIDPHAIERAEAAMYGPHAFRSTTPAWRTQHFEPLADGSWWVKDPYRERTRFRRLNLLAIETALAGRRFDAVFCRNVLIYFDRATQLDVVRQLGRLLVPGGYLCLGHSEIFIGEDLGLAPLTTARATMYRRAVAS